MYVRSPFNARITVVRRLNCSTIPFTWAGSSLTKSPIPYQRSKAINAPAITSIRKRCAPNPTRTRTRAEPPSAATVPGRNALTARITTTIAATYGIAVAIDRSGGATCAPAGRRGLVDVDRGAVDDDPRRLHGRRDRDRDVPPDVQDAQPCEVGERRLPSPLGAASSGEEGDISQGEDMK